MSLFGRHREDKRDGADKADAPVAENSDAVAEGMVTASDGDLGKLASLIVQHRMQHDRRIWGFLQRRLGNARTSELQDQVAKTAEAPAAPSSMQAAAGPDYKAFCAAFATTFASAMSAFPGGMTEATVPLYFTAEQVGELTKFMASNVVPPDLFHQASGPKLTAQQRIILAGVILARGILPPELQGKQNQARDKPQDGRLHASSCGAWAQQVMSYAGAGIAKYNQQETQTVDSGGTLHLGNATTEKTFGSHADTTGLQLEGSQKKAKEAQDTREATARAEAEAAGVPYVEPKDHQEFSRKAEMGDEMFAALQPGDWIYIYNANTTATGQHSEIFVGWADEGIQTDKSSGVRYRTANVMSQLHTEDGGKVHKQKLGTAHAPGIAPVTAINRVAETSAELLDVRSLVASDAVEKNAKIIEEKHLDEEQLHGDLLKTAKKELANLVSKKLDDHQQKVFEKALGEATADRSPEAFALLVALVQRMDLKSGGVFTGRPANGILDEVIVPSLKTSKSKKKG